jgi:hypothetical protein
MTPRDPEGSPLFRLPLLVVALVFAALVVVQWVDDAVDARERMTEARR